jgi:hypothetical protein
MKRLSAIAILALGAVTGLGAAPAVAQEKQLSPLSQCLIANATPELEALAKTMLLQALQDQTAQAKETMLSLGLVMINLGVSKCGLKLSDVEKPETGEAFEAFGEFIGEKVFAKTLEKITE